MPEPNFALFYTEDAFTADSPQLMGMHAASSGFFRAYAGGLGDSIRMAYCNKAAQAEHFAAAVKAVDPSARTAWVRTAAFDQLARVGALHRPDPLLRDLAFTRLRAGPRAWSIFGVTHTTATARAMQALCDLVTAPLFPWDALICTSRAVRETVTDSLEKQADYLRWRLGSVAVTLPQLPVIPLGVHCDDFEFSEEQRRAARAELGFGAGDVVFVYVGRLNPHSKAHPHAMYTALQRFAGLGRVPVGLVQCGWFGAPETEAAYREGAARHCPDVATRFLDGRQAAQRATAWAAADVFISLPDNIQETFGLTPIEAMAAGLPSIVSDWDGYRDTVRQGIDGYRIPTWMPAAPAGVDLALYYETEAYTYEAYVAQVSQAVSIDPETLFNAVARLAGDPPLRVRMGAAARGRAREAFDWSQIFARYLTLVEELNDLRRCYPSLSPGEAPRESPAHPDPFARFARYATRRIEDTTLVELVAPPPSSIEALRKDPLFVLLAAGLPNGERSQRLLDALAEESPLALEALAARAEIPPIEARRALGWLAKVGLVRLKAPPRTPPPAAPDAAADKPAAEAAPPAAAASPF
jgi:starch synthase